MKKKIKFKQVDPKSILIFIGVLFYVVANGFSQDAKRDTSYTVNSAFLKYKKDFPSIEVAKANAKNASIRKNVIYHNTKLRDLKLDIYSPKNNDQNFPTIFLIHGGGWKSGDKSHMRALGTALAERGYVAMAMEYRLSPEAKYPAGVEDMKAAVRWAMFHASELNVDTSQLVLLGCSSGAQMASLIGMTAHENGLLIQAVINLDGILAFHHPESREGASAALWLGGTYAEAKENWEEASPLTHAGKGDPPILFVNSQYPRFHAGRDAMITILNQEGIYTEVHEWPDSPHTFWLFDPWFEPTVDLILNFLNETLRK